MTHVSNARLFVAAKAKYAEVGEVYDLGNEDNVLVLEVVNERGTRTVHFVNCVVVDDFVESVWTRRDAEKASIDWLSKFYELVEPANIVFDEIQFAMTSDNSAIIKWTQRMFQSAVCAM